MQTWTEPCEDCKLFEHYSQGFKCADCMGVAKLRMIRACVTWAAVILVILMVIAQTIKGVGI